MHEFTPMACLFCPLGRSGRDDSPPKGSRLLFHARGWEPLAAGLLASALSGCGASAARPNGITNQNRRGNSHAPARTATARTKASTADAAHRPGWGDQAGPSRPGRAGNRHRPLGNGPAQNPTDQAIHTDWPGPGTSADAHMRKQGVGSDPYLNTFKNDALASPSGSWPTAMPNSRPPSPANRTSPKPLRSSMNRAFPARIGTRPVSAWARAKGFTTILANKDRIKTVMSRVMALNPAYLRRPDRYFGAFYAVAPSFGGDMTKSKTHYEKSLARAALRRDPRADGRECSQVKDRALFDKLLDEVLAQDDNAAQSWPETRVEQGQSVKGEGRGTV